MPVNELEEYQRTLSRLEVLLVGIVLLHFSIGMFMGLRVFSLMMMVLALGYMPPYAALIRTAGHFT